MRGQIPGQGQDRQVFMMSGGWRPREIRLWGKRDKGMSQTTGSLIFSTPAPSKDCSMCVLGIILGRPLLCSPSI